jgi:ribonuclease P protein component
MEGHYLQLIVAKAPAEGGRTGFIIGRKVSKRAVDRNRIRRKLREVLRALPVAADRFDLVLRVTRAKNKLEQDAATAEAARLLDALIANEPAARGSP